MIRSMFKLLSLVVGLATASVTVGGCAAQRSMAPSMKALALNTAKPVLKRNHFKQDRSTAVSEEQIHRILDAPVFLEKDARVGIVPVASGYAPDPDLPLATVPGSVSTALERSGLFEVTTEVSTDWPTHTGIAGLRELATRYRCEYLLLYRHRFVDREWTNGWGAMWLTVIGGFFVPMNTIETAGVVEATLFEVKTGTLLFTVYERVSSKADENIWQNDRKRRAHKRDLLDTATDAIAKLVVGKVRLLAAARPDTMGVAPQVGVLAPKP